MHSRFNDSGPGNSDPGQLSRFRNWENVIGTATVEEHRSCGKHELLTFPCNSPLSDFGAISGETAARKFQRPRDYDLGDAGRLLGSSSLADQRKPDLIQMVTAECAYFFSENSKSTRRQLIADSRPRKIFALTRKLSERELPRFENSRNVEMTIIC